MVSQIARAIEEDAGRAEGGGDRRHEKEPPLRAKGGG
jgi:hypothetical protein